MCGSVDEARATLTLTGGAPALRSNGAIAQHEYDEHESARYQRRPEPIHPLVLLLGRLVGVDGERTSDGDQNCDSCRDVENGSPGFAVQDK
jgi:hypothetical protein